MLTQMSIFLRRSMGRRSIINIMSNNNNTSVAKYTHVKSCYSSFGSQTYVGGVIGTWTQKTASMCYQHCKEQEHVSESEGGYNLEEENIIKNGYFVNLSQLLFTQDRCYLIRCNHPNQLVMAKDLAGKHVVIYFVPLHCASCHGVRYSTKYLTDTYNDLKSKNCFEVVLVVVDDVTSSDGEPGQLCLDPSLEEKFQDIVSECPSWLAIPFSDITSRMRLKRQFGIFHRLSYSEMFHIDSTGIFVDNFLELLIKTYGSVAFPFKEIWKLKYNDKTASCSLSLKELLGSSERDFVISNNGDKVPINTLEDKVVALFFYEDGCSPDFVAIKLKTYYEELKRNGDFEVVLLYLSDTDDTIVSTNEETFWETFKTMPWLALPFKDPALKKLKRIFDYPDERYDNLISEPMLVVVGPRRDAIESGAFTILSEYDQHFFMHKEFAKAEGERIREIKLDMLCSPTTVFKTKDGFQVQFSDLAGKRIIFLFEGDYPEYDGLCFRKNLEESYKCMKGTADEFEVIYFPNNKDERVACVPWLVSCAVELLPDCSAFLSFYGNCLNRYKSSYLLAFDRDGSLVRRTICPRQFYDEKFPFNADIVESKAFDISSSNFCWGYWDTLYQGLLRHSKRQVNFPSGNLLCCVYFY